MEMNYEIVTLEEKKIAGLSARTSNSAEDMQQVIGGMWSRFYQDGIHEAIPHKANEKALGIYTDYEQDIKGEYTAIVACEVTETGELPQGVISRVIPSGKYARFVVKGDMHQAVAEFWGKLWGMELPRTFTYDFEEYQDDNMEHSEIHMYIAIKG